MTGWSVDGLSARQSFGVKLALLGGVAGVLAVAGVLPDALPVQEEPRPERASVRAAPVPRVDINHGSSETLQTLPGIGTVLAERIVQYRREHGHFASAADVKNVRGIGVKRFEQLRPHIRVDQPERDSGG